jgi:hypothetical protein
LAASILFALLAAGSASALSLNPGKNGVPTKFPVLYENVKIEAVGGTGWSRSVTCASGHGSGRFTSGTAGEIPTVEFTQCKRNLTHTCTTPGSPSGTVVAKYLKFKLAYLDAAHTQYGLWFYAEPFFFESPVGVIAEFECLGSKYKWQGSVIGRIVSPALNAESTKIDLSFENAGVGIQKYQQIEGGGPKYHLSQVEGGVWNEAAMIAQSNITFPYPVKIEP